MSLQYLMNADSSSAAAKALFSVYAKDDKTKRQNNNFPYHVSNIPFHTWCCHCWEHLHIDDWVFLCPLLYSITYAHRNTHFSLCSFFLVSLYSYDTWLLFSTSMSLAHKNLAGDVPRPKLVDSRWLFYRNRSAFSSTTATILLGIHWVLRL